MINTSFTDIRTRLTAIMFCAVLGLSAGAAGAGCLDEGLAVSQPHLRATAPNAPVSAGYLQIKNQTGQTQTLVAASAPFAKTAEIHDMVHQDGVMKMFELEGGLVVPDGQSAALKPKARHLMFMGLDRQLKPDQRFDITLTFAPCGAVTVPFTVMKIGGPSHGHSHKH